MSGPRPEAQFSQESPLPPKIRTIGTFIITNTILGVPYYNYSIMSIMGPKTLFQLLRTLY